MIKTPFIEAIDEKLRPEERIFKLRSAELSGNIFIVTLLVDHNAYDVVLDDVLKEKVMRIAKEIIPEAFSLTVKYVKANAEESTIIKRIMEFIYNEKPTVYSGFIKSKIEVESDSDLIIVRIILAKYLYEYAVNSGLKEELERHIGSWVMEDVEVEFVAVPNTDDAVIDRRVQIKSSPIGTIKIEINRYLCGTIPSEPRYISDVAQKELEDVVLCGAVSNVKSRYIEKIKKNLFSFNINDTSGNLKVKYFAKPYIEPMDEVKEKLAKKLRKTVEEIEEENAFGVNWSNVFVDGAILVFQGKLSFDNFDKVNVLMAKNVAECTIDYSSINLKKDFLPEPENYVHIFPESILANVQNNLFVTRNNPELEKHEYVVFDLETTGLDAMHDLIIEIGAIKIINGEIKQSFSCLVNPGIEIPPRITEITNITDQMVENCYKIEDVIGDFYKFTRNSIMVAHNAPFDMGFISVAGKKYLYDFDNAYIDTLAMSRQTLPSLRHHNLESICKYFNVSLIGAHRAVNDALATAKVFIELMNRQNY